MDEALVKLVVDLMAAAGRDVKGPAVAGTALFLLVYVLTKVPRVSAVVLRVLDSDNKRRAFALLMALAPGVATMLTGALAWDKALATSVVSFAVATTIHFLSKSDVRGALVLLAALALPQAGCVGGQQQAARVAEAIADVVEVGEPALQRAYEREQMACLEPDAVMSHLSAKFQRAFASYPGSDYEKAAHARVVVEREILRLVDTDEQACIDTVRGAWAPVFQALEALRVAWCSLVPEGAGCARG
jgi:hypothetical protein